MQSLPFDFDFGDIFANLFVNFFNYVFGIGDDSLIMGLWNLLPLVGSNPVSNETFVMLIASFGVFVFYFRTMR